MEYELHAWLLSSWRTRQKYAVVHCNEPVGGAMLVRLVESGPLSHSTVENWLFVLICHWLAA